jgi:hypothetical protein
MYLAGRAAHLDEANREITRYLRERISQRERAQHQVAVLSGGTTAAAASIMASTAVSPWLILGLSVLVLAFAFSMLNNDYHIIASALFIVSLRSDDAAAQRAWEIHIQREVGRTNHGASLFRPNLQLVTPYAVPVLSTLGATVFFLVSASGWQRCAVIVPLTLSVLFAFSALDVRNRYSSISEKAKALTNPSCMPYEQETPGGTAAHGACRQED